MINLVKGQKLRSELIFFDEITYFVDPVSYYDDGCRKIYKFLDEDNNIYVWKTSKSLGVDFVDENGDEMFEFVNPGDRVFVYGTVKDISQYRGEDQIVITRCKIYDILEHGVLSEDDILKIKRDIQLSKYPSIQEIRTVRYKDYKNEYQKYETLIDSFVRNDKGCFIDIIVA